MTAPSWMVATLAFVLELGALAVLCWWGWTTGTPTSVAVLLAVVLPGTAAVLWALFAAPRARHPSRWGRPLVQLVVFGSAAAALADLASPAVGVVAAAVVVLDVALAAVLPPVGRPVEHPPRAS